MFGSCRHLWRHLAQRRARMASTLYEGSANAIDDVHIYCGWTGEWMSRSSAFHLATCLGSAPTWPLFSKYLARRTRISRQMDHTSPGVLAAAA